VPVIDRTAEAKSEAIEHLLASRHFAKAPLLSAFLRYVWDRSNAPGPNRVTEQEIGFRVFHRRPGYDPGEDNIVRNYARQLRKRLEEYYLHEGKQDRLRIDVPRGGYVPVFIEQEPETLPPPVLEMGVSAAVFAEPSPAAPSAASPARRHHRLSISLGAGFAMAIQLCLGIWLFLPHAPLFDSGARSFNRFWRQIFATDKSTFIVPADTGFVMVQEMSGRTYSLAEFESWPGIEQYDHVYSSYLKAQKYTSVLDLKVVSQVERLPQVANSRLSIRSAREMKIEDLSDGNAILLGSIYSNPWIEAFQGKLNFHFVYSPSESRSWIANLHPLAGEQPNYGSSWSSYSHNTYAVLAFVPNLAKNGHVLLIQGLDGAGTEAAANMALSKEGFRPILEKARRADGSFRSFEVLIEATSLDSHATSPHVLSLRLMEN
jgi:hypothetical protein